MDFARKQMEKYGWTDGKGLGKHENGISEALKPKLKRSVTGVGHDAAADFTEHWWSALYDKAAGNVEVKEKNGKTKKIKTKDKNEFEITNSTWRLKKKRKTDDVEEQYQDFFVRTSVLTNGGSKTTNVRDSDSEGETEKKDVVTLTDEELFAACEGRTAHKGARHGLKALGKLARIAQQEAMLLSQPQYNGYSHAKNKKEKHEAVVEEINLSQESEETNVKKKKKKKKYCSNNTDNFDSGNTDATESESMQWSCVENENTLDGSVADESKKYKLGRKDKSREHTEVNDANENFILAKSKKKKRRKADKEDYPIVNTEQVIDSSNIFYRKNKRKDKNSE